MSTVIIDYGLGNLRSVQKAIEFLGFPVKVSSEPQVISAATKLILPGVGAIGQAMRNLRSLGLVEVIKDVIKQDKPFLGICLGMQILMSVSEENGPTPGLEVIAGQVRNFRSNPDFKQSLPVPHMGWNDVNVKGASPLFSGLGASFQAYFVHSYYVAPADKQLCIGETEYGLNFCSALQRQNIYAIQFHPEKSGQLGLKILKNFLEN